MEELLNDYPLIVGLLGQAILILGNAGIPVFIGNLIKNVPGAEKLNGKIGGIVNWMIITLFVFMFTAGQFYDPGFLLEVLPEYGEKVGQVLAIITGMIDIYLVMKLKQPIYDRIKGTPVIGKSFSK